MSGIDWEKLARLLVKELTSCEVEQVLKAASDDFQNLSRVMDWRNYASKKWLDEVGDEEKIVEVAMAMKQASSEEWD